jgi:hypothetical protein
MQNVIAAVGEDHLLAGALPLGPFGDQFLASEDLSQRVYSTVGTGRRPISYGERAEVLMLETILIGAAFLAFGIYVARLVVPVVVAAVVPEVVRTVTKAVEGPGANFR